MAALWARAERMPMTSETKPPGISIGEMSRAPPKLRKAMSKRMERNMTKFPPDLLTGSLVLPRQ